MNSKQPIDLEVVRREIEAEVRSRRAAGEYPPGFEREMDALFARFAPPEALEDYDAAIERAEELVAIEPVIPVASRNPALALVKRVVSKLIGWYHVWLAQQLTSLGSTITHTIRLLGRRVHEVERITGDAALPRAEIERHIPVRPDEQWAPLVLDALGSTAGRVLVLEAGRGELLGALTRVGLDAYGVESRREAADAAVECGLDVLLADPMTHLTSVAEGALSALVLRGCVELYTTGELLRLADLAITGVAQQGTIVVCSISPSSWPSAGTEVEADLAAGRPLHAETWAVVLTDRGFTDVETWSTADGGAYVVRASR